MKITHLILAGLVTLLTACGGATSAPEGQLPAHSDSSEEIRSENDRPTDPIKPPVTVHTVEIELEDPTLFGTAQFSAVDHSGRRIRSESLDESDLIEGEDYTFLILSESLDGVFYGQVEVTNIDGSVSVYTLQKGVFKQSPIRLSLNSSRIERGADRGQILTAKLSTSAYIDPEEVESLMVIADTNKNGGFIDISRDEAVEWDEMSLKIDQLPLGTDDSNVTVAVCIELEPHDAPVSQLVCSNFLLAD